MLTDKNRPDVAGVSKQVDVGHEVESDIDPLRHELREQQGCQLCSPRLPAQT